MPGVSGIRIRKPDPIRDPRLRYGVRLPAPRHRKTSSADDRISGNKDKKDKDGFLT